MQIIIQVKKVSVICINAQPYNDGRVSITYNKEARWWGGENSSIIRQIQKCLFGIVETAGDGKRGFDEAVRSLARAAGGKVGGEEIPPAEEGGAGSTRQRRSTRKVASPPPSPGAPEDDFAAAGGESADEEEEADLEQGMAPAAAQ